MSTIKDTLEPIPSSYLGVLKKQVNSSSFPRWGG